jgi:hypothetical protein
MRSRGTITLLVQKTQGHPASAKKHREEEVQEAAEESGSAVT